MPRQRYTASMKACEQIYLCDPAWQQALLNELAATQSAMQHTLLQPGWVGSRATSATATALPQTCLAFSQQLLPTPVPLQEPSISRWAATLADLLRETLGLQCGAWRLHLVALPAPGASLTPGRARLIEAALDDILHKKLRALRRARTDSLSAHWHSDEALVQLILHTRTEAVFSCCLPSTRGALHNLISPFPAGLVDIPVDKAPPARAYRKLLEAQLHLGCHISKGEHVVDLGAAPGSWTHLALSRGARVTAVDRSPLRADLMAHPGTSFIQGDGFAYEPTAPVDWLLCDIISAPQRSRELLLHWLDRGLCRHLVTTLKFSGSQQYHIVQTLCSDLERRGSQHLLRHLSANHNEVTVMAHSAQA